MGRDNIEEVISIIDIGGEGFDCGFQIGIDLSRGDTFSREEVEATIGVARVTKFVDFEEDIQRWSARLGIEKGYIVIG